MRTSSAVTAALTVFAVLASFVASPVANAAEGEDLEVPPNMDAPRPVEPPPPPPRSTFWQLGARTGYTRALDTTTPLSMTTQTPSLLPLMIELGYRNPNIYVGVFGQAALASRTDCGGGGTCAAKDYQVGVNFHYHARPGQFVDPWFGLGVAYETLHLSGIPAFPNINVDRKGVDFAILQAGADFRLGSGETGLRPHIGPFLGLAFGEMSSQGTNGISQDGINSHQWLSIGVRGTLDL